MLTMSLLTGLTALSTPAVLPTTSLMLMTPLLYPYSLLYPFLSDSCKKAKNVINGLELDPSQVGIVELDEMGEEVSSTCNIVYTPT